MTVAPTPLISVLVPCYNLGAYVDEAVQSVLAQTEQDFEILVVDDGSTDDATVSLLASARWPRTTIFRTENRGLARARNFLIERSSGQYLCALDADDKLHPEYFERTLAAFARDPSLAFVSTRLQMFGCENRVFPPETRCDLTTLLCDCPIFSAALVRKAAVDGLGGYDEAMIHGDEDWDLWISLLEAGASGVMLPEVLFFYRRRTGSMCDLCTRGEMHLELVKYLMHKHWNSYQTHLLEVLRWKDLRIDEMRLENARLDDELATLLEPAAALRRVELDRLEGLRERLRKTRADREQLAAAPNTELEAQRTELEALRAEYQRCLAEIDALRSSVSWKITAPLRLSYDLYQRRNRSSE